MNRTITCGNVRRGVGVSMELSDETQYRGATLLAYRVDTFIGRRRRRSTWLSASQT